MTWGPAPSGSEVMVIQSDSPKPADATLTFVGPQAGFYQVTAKATVDYKDPPCTDDWTGSGSTTVLITVSTCAAVPPTTCPAGSNSNPTVTATADSASLTACQSQNVTTNLHASDSTPPTGCPNCPASPPIWSWSQSIQYSADNVTWGPAPSGTEVMVIQSDSPKPADATLIFAASEAGYYQVTAKATVDYKDPPCTDDWNGTGSTTVLITVYECIGGLVTQPPPSNQPCPPTG